MGRPAELPVISGGDPRPPAAPPVAPAAPLAAPAGRAAPPPPLAAPAIPPAAAARQEAPESVVAAPPAADPGTSASVGGGGLRVFIHHAASDRTGAAQAQQLADQLRREGYPTVVTRQVRVRVTAPGVRYFFPADREPASRLLRTSARFLAPRGGRPPGTPTDFTHLQPKPRPGTLEVWVPAP
jgi:hypothetical protein